VVGLPVDTSLNNLVLNNALKQQKPAAKSEVASARAEPGVNNGTPQPTSARQAPPLSVVSVLVPAVLITNEQQITEISQPKRSDKDSDAPETDLNRSPDEGFDNNFNANDAKRGAVAYQAAGAVSGAGITESSFAAEPEIFSPQNINPIDIEV